MKKILVTLLALSMCFAICACSAKPADEPAAAPTAPADMPADEPSVEPDDEPAEEPSAGVAKPVTELTRDDLASLTGFLLDVPEGATDAKWSSIDQGEAAPIAQLDFTLDGIAYFYRVQSTSETETYDMSGLNYTFTAADADVAGRAAKVFTCDEAGYISWLDVVPGVNYNLGAVGAVTAEDLTRVAGLIFQPLQSEA